MSDVQNITFRDKCFDFGIFKYILLYMTSLQSASPSEFPCTPTVTPESADRYQVCSLRGKLSRVLRKKGFSILARLLSAEGTELKAQQCRGSGSQLHQLVPKFKLDKLVLLES